MSRQKLNDILSIIMPLPVAWMDLQEKYREMSDLLENIYEILCRQKIRKEKAPCADKSPSGIETCNPPSINDKKPWSLGKVENTLDNDRVKDVEENIQCVIAAQSTVDEKCVEKETAASILEESEPMSDVLLTKVVEILKYMLKKQTLAMENLTEGSKTMYERICNIYGAPPRWLYLSVASENCNTQKNVPSSDVSSENKLGKISFTNAVISKTPTNDLKELYKLAFGRRETPDEIQNNLHFFCGYSEDAKDYETKKKSLENCQMKVLKQMGKDMGVEEADKKNKDEIVKSIMDLNTPKGMDKMTPQSISAVKQKQILMAHPKLDYILSTITSLPAQWIDVKKAIRSLRDKLRKVNEKLCRREIRRENIRAHKSTSGIETHSSSSINDKKSLSSGKVDSIEKNTSDDVKNLEEKIQCVIAAPSTVDRKFVENETSAFILKLNESDPTSDVWMTKVVEILQEMLQKQTLSLQNLIDSQQTMNEWLRKIYDIDPKSIVSRSNSSVNRNTKKNAPSSEPTPGQASASIEITHSPSGEVDKKIRKENGGVDEEENDESPKCKISKQSET